MEVQYELVKALNKMKHYGIIKYLGQDFRIQLVHP